MKSHLTRAIRWLSYLLTIAAIIYFVRRFAAHFDGIRDLGPAGPLGLLLVATSVAYALLLVLLAWAWRDLLKAAGAQVGSFLAPFEVYSRSQIGKYLPGNVFHFVGRQVLGIRKGWSHTELGAASVFENILLILAASACTVFGVTSWYQRELSQGPAASLWIAPIVVLIAWGSLIALGRFTRLKKSDRFAAFRKLATSSVLFRAWVLQVTFFVGCGILLWTLAHWRIPGLDLRDLPVFLFAFSVSWLVGFVSPGAPGGIGIREVMLTLTLRKVIPEADTLLLGALLRLVTTGGDFLLWSAGALVGARVEKRPETPHSSLHPRQEQP